MRIGGHGNSNLVALQLTTYSTCSSACPDRDFLPYIPYSIGSHDFKLSDKGLGSESTAFRIVADRESIIEDDR
jgi:hypothetical protein